MALTAAQNRLYLWLKSSLPSWAFATSAGELWQATAVVFDTVRSVGAAWIGATYILRATGSWLDLHAAERGTRRRLGETDESLRERLRNPEDAVTAPSLVIAADAILVANGGPAGATIISVRKNAGRFMTDAVTGRATVYLSRGYRMSSSTWPSYPGAPAGWAGSTASGRRGSGIVMMLPYGTSGVAAGAVLEMMRAKAAGGFWKAVETRGVP